MIKIESLEIHASNHCNLSCKGCMHFSSFEKEKYIDNISLEEDLKILKGILDIGVIRLLGGEPLLNIELPKVISVVKRCKLSDRISIATNGVNLSRWVNNPMWNDVNECEITLYPNTQKIYRSILTNCNIIAKKYKVKIYIYHCEYFRIPGSIDISKSKILTDNIFKTCLIAKNWQCFNLFESKFYLCPQAFAFVRNGIGDSNCSDWVDLHNCRNLELELYEYINRQVPLSICSHCYGSCGLREKHTQFQRNGKCASDMVTASYEMGIDYKYLDSLLNDDVNRNSMETLSKVQIINFN